MFFSKRSSYSDVPKTTRQCVSRSLFPHTRARHKKSAAGLYRVSPMYTVCVCVGECVRGGSGGSGGGGTYVRYSLPPPSLGCVCKIVAAVAPHTYTHRRRGRCAVDVMCVCYSGRGPRTRADISLPRSRTPPVFFILRSCFLSPRVYETPAGAPFLSCLFIFFLLSCPLLSASHFFTL